MITLIITVFVLGYLAIALEHNIRINKAASALITGVLCWTLYAFTQSDHHLVSHQLAEHLGEISGILFFLMGAMTIVELIDAHDGFEIITSRIKTQSQRKLLWIIAFITFFLSPVLDNLTTTIVMVSLLRKLLPEGQSRLLFVSMVVIAANAGGAWSPIGDVTTTMLWIGGQITTSQTVINLVLPSLICLLIPLMIAGFRIHGNIEKVDSPPPSKLQSTPVERNIVFWAGVVSLIAVPVFKSVTHLPPYMGILGALGIVWIITELMHGKKPEKVKDTLSVLHAIRKIDMPSILFFLGILLSIGVLQNTGILHSLADWLDSSIGNINTIVIMIGFLSALIDNVPLVAAAMGMYDMNSFPVDHHFWQFIAYSAGTGGSMVIIGSAAGVAAMGMEKINFFWYLKNISWLALIGFLAGAGIFILQSLLFG